MSDHNPLKLLKRSHDVPSSNSLYTDKREVIFFCLDDQPEGVIVKVLNRKRKRVFPHPDHYHSPISNVLRYLDGVKNLSSWKSSWAENSNEIYITDHPELLPMLLKCGNLITSNGDPIQIQEEEVSLVLRSKPAMSNRKWMVVPGSENQKASHFFQFLGISCLLSKNTIFKIPPVYRPELLKTFNCTLPEYETEKLLSLFHTHFPEGIIEYDNYHIMHHGRLKMESAVILEEVDLNGVLTLRVGCNSEKIDHELLNQYDLSRIAQVHHAKKQIALFEIQNTDTDSGIRKIQKMLRALRKSGEFENVIGYSFKCKGDLFYIESDLAQLFLYKHLKDILKDFTLIGNSCLKYYNLKIVRPKLSLQVSSGINFLSADGDVDMEGQIYPLNEFLEKSDDLTFIKLGDGVNGIIEHRFMNQIKRIFKRKEDGKFQFSFFDLPLVEELIDEKTSSREYLNSRAILMGINQVYETPFTQPSIQAELRQYQQHGFKWLEYLYSNGLGACLADDMGLGKTIQTLALLGNIYPEADMPTLIVMPNSLLHNWQSEAEKFTPHLKTRIYHGSKRNQTVFRECHLVFTTYGTLRSDIDSIRKIPFEAVVLDESQHIKNITSHISKAVMLLNAKWKLALSGTPIENNVGEIYALYRFLNPGMFGEISSFRKDYFEPIKENDEYAISDLKRKIYPFMLRRLKQDVLKDLPKKTEQVITVDMSEEQAEFYHERRIAYRHLIKTAIANGDVPESRMILLQALNELRQIASIPENKSDGEIIGPKRAVLLNFLTDIVANGHKVLVFSNYLNTLELLKSDLQARDISCLTITGAVKNRSTIVDRFQNGSKASILLMTLKTGGVGLNLTAADYVFIYDPWWNTSAEQQAVDRTHRIGQVNKVFSYKLIAKNTIEEKILQLQKQKHHLIESLLHNDQQGIKALTTDDIDYMFS